MGTHWALLFFHAMFGDPEPLGRQIDHLASLWHLCWVGAQIVLALLAAEDWMNEDLIRRLHLPQMMSTMSWLSTGLPAALVPQALGRTHKTIGGGRQTAIMAIFGLLPFEGLDALAAIVPALHLCTATLRAMPYSQLGAVRVLHPLSCCYSTKLGSHPANE